MPHTTVLHSSQLSKLPDWERDPNDDLRRLSVLIGFNCPRCGLPMVLAGTLSRPRLMCQQAFGYGSQCCYSYSNPDYAEDELRPH